MLQSSTCHTNSICNITVRNVITTFDNKNIGEKMTEQKKEIKKEVIVTNVGSKGDNIILHLRLSARDSIRQAYFEINTNIAHALHAND